jgi:hypothetical protein
MMIGAKITLNTRIDAARDGLACLAGDSWLLSIPGRRWGRGGHPAGSALPGSASSGEPCPIAVTFGNLAERTTPSSVLPVRWESLEPGDTFAVLLDADIILAPAADQATGVLVLAGVCRLPDSLDADGHEQARTRVSDAAKDFITSVATAVTLAAASGPGVPRSERTGFSEPSGPGGLSGPGGPGGLGGQAMSWLSELPGGL